MRQLKITKFYKKLKATKQKSKKAISKKVWPNKRVLRQPRMTDYWDKFTRIKTMSLFEFYTGKTKKEFWASFSRN